MKLTLDIALNAHSLANASQVEHQNLAYLLSRGRRVHHAMPLEAYVCREFGLSAAPDFPIAPIAAKADGLTVENHRWFRADPVHFVLQRDAFSLHDEVPMVLDPAHAKKIIVDLNQHFAHLDLHFAYGRSGHWYVNFPENSTDFYPVTTALPACVASKSVQHFFPQGQAAKKWRSVLNEVQMLLHEHPVNQEREKVQQLPVNSIWISGGGQLPGRFVAQIQQSELMIANHPLYAGLANLAGVNFLDLPHAATFLTEHQTQHLRMLLTEEHIQNTQSAWISTVLALVKKRKIRSLTLNVGFFEDTLSAHVAALDLLKIWRRPTSLIHLLEALRRA